ncbi:MAG: hypothetical protein Q4A54_10255 [Parabacteroides sp.]|nr:hypothetical protein [Parabacteroides sp.]
MQWFKNEALNVDEGWTIIVFAHALYLVHNSTNKLDYIGAEFIKAIDEYNGKGVIACVLQGHSHVDRIHIGMTDVPYILTQCDRTEPYDKYDINVYRVRGTISEQHFEVVVLDKGKQEVKLFSIGSNARDGVDNEPGKEVDVRIVKYGKQ